MIGKVREGVIEGTASRVSDENSGLVGISDSDDSRSSFDVRIEWRNPVYTREVFVKSYVYCVAAALLAAAAIPASAQQGVVMDWSTHHVVFTNPGPEMDAIMNGHRQQWQDFVNNPRYRMQQTRRSAAWANRFAAINSVVSEVRENKDSSSAENQTSMNNDWTVAIGPSGSGTAFDMYPAAYASNSTNATCSDFVVFPVNTPGKSGTGDGQANFVGFNNLYSGTCTGAVPKVAFALYVGQGTFQTSPVISVFGNEVALIESKNSTTGTNTNFHVITLGTNGTGNGSAYNSPAVPHTIVNNGVTKTTSATNNVTDAYVTLDGNPNVTRSSPFIDYLGDIAYAGDDSGVLHKITPVFNGTPVEIKGGGWPVTVASGVILTGPVLDLVTGNIFVGGSDGNLYCIVSTTGAPCSTSNVSVGNGSTSSGAVIDAPIVSSNGTSSWVFSEAGAVNGVKTESVLLQATSSLGSVQRNYLGVGGTDLYNGDFDNAYYSATSSYASGHIYFCGNIANAATPRLYQVGFNTTGTMNNSSHTTGPQLVTTGQTGTANDCTPLTEVFNGTTDMLFVGVKGNGRPSGCSSEGCIMSFNLGSTFNPLLAPTAVYPLGGSGSGSSGLVIDNTTTQAGASNIYFSNLQSATSATQASQSALK